MLSEKKKNRCAADSGSSSYSVFRTAKQILPMQRQSRHFLPRITASVLQMGTVTVPQSPKPLPVHSYHLAAQGKPQSRPARQAVIVNLRQHRTIPALRLKHRSGGCGTASALPKCSIMSGCGTRIVLRGKSPSHSATAAPASVRCFRHWRRSPSVSYTHLDVYKRQTLNR